MYKPLLVNTEAVLYMQSLAGCLAWCPAGTHRSLLKCEGEREGKKRHNICLCANSSVSISLSVVLLKWCRQSHSTSLAGSTTATSRGVRGVSLLSPSISPNPSLAPLSL